MARPRRWDAPGAVHHVMVRGIDGRKIFLDDDDRLDFLDRLDRVLPECGIRCLARALLPNHVHAVLQTGDVPLWRAMQRVNTGYARRFNKVHERRGYVFQGRFRSRLVDEDTDLAVVVRYVLLNPIRHGLIPDLGALERDPWSSSSVLFGHQPARPADDVASALNLIDERHERARSRLRSWLAAGLTDPSAARSDLAAPESVSPDVCRRELAPARVDETADLPPAPTFDVSIGARPDVSELAENVCSERGVTQEELRGRSRVRSVSAARAILAYRAVCEAGIPPARVAEYLGLTASAVSQCVRRGREVLGRERRRGSPSRGRDELPSPGGTTSDS